MTSSVLLTGKALNAGALRTYGRTRKLFSLRKCPGSPVRSLTEIVPARMQALDAGVRHLTGGKRDLPDILFLSLLLVAVVEILKGNFRMPPWYTAFWYAFGVFSKSMMDRSIDASENHPADATLYDDTSTGTAD
jgi:hypothetical protein